MEGNYMSPIFNVIDKMVIEDIKNFKPELSSRLAAFTFCINENIVEDQLFKELVKLIEKLTHGGRTYNKDLDVQIKKIMYTLMEKHGYNKNKACEELFNDLHEIFKKKN